MNEEYIDNVKHLIEQKDADQVKSFSPTYTRPTSPNCATI